MRWKGLFDERSLVAAGGDEKGCDCGTGGAAGTDACGPDSEDWDIFLKYGFRDSSAAGGLDRGVESLTLLVEEGTAGGTAGGAGGEATFDSTWLLVGVVS